MEKAKRGVRFFERYPYLKKMLSLVYGVLYYAYNKVLFVINDGLYYIYRFLCFLLPLRTLSRLKFSLNPTMNLDYARHKIPISTDSPLMIYRSRACTKEPETIAWIEDNVKAGDVFYDVGANIGAYSLIAAKFALGDIKVVAFEPSFSTYYYLCRNVILNNCQNTIRPYMIALSNQVGPLVFRYHSLEAGSAEHILSPNSSPGLKNILPVYEQQIFSFSIDVLINDYSLPSPQHIKLDVDGAEYNVLLGASNTLKSGGVKSLLVEVRTVDGKADEITQYLAAFGFKLTSRNDRGDGVIWNYIFTRE